MYTVIATTESIYRVALTDARPASVALVERRHAWQGGDLPTCEGTGTGRPILGTAFRSLECPST